MSGPPGHRVLVVEDNADERADVCALLESLGESVRAVATVEQALAALGEERFCLIVCDQALPLREGLGDFVTGGERIVRTARAMDRRRTEEGADVTPILAFTSYSEKSAFVTGLFEAGITTFVPKPLSSNMTYFLEKYRGVLGRAGRSNHGKCAALATSTPTAPAPATRKPLVAGGLAAELGATQWSDLKVVPVNGHTLRIQCGKAIVRRTYADLGFAGANRNPIDKWRVVLEVCAGGGYFRGNKTGAYEAAKNAVCVTQKLLKSAFGLDDNPFHHYRRGLGWQAKFGTSSEIASEASER